MQTKLKNLACPCPHRSPMSSTGEILKCTKSECEYSTKGFDSIGGIPVLIAFNQVDTVCDQKKIFSSEKLVGFNFTNIPPVPPTAPDQNTRELSSVVYI